MRIKSAHFVLVGLSLGLWGCLGSPSPMDPSAELGCLSGAQINTVTISPSKVIITVGPKPTNPYCPLPPLNCGNATEVVHSHNQLLSLETACGGPQTTSTCKDPCDFNTQMLIGYFMNVSCMASGTPAITSVCYSKSQVVVTITVPPIPTQVPGGIAYQCNSFIQCFQWVAVPASNLPVVFNYN